MSLLYEAAVCGSIPVIRNLEEYYDNDLLNSFSGIVNGSTNFILTKMKEEGLSYENALKQAQQLGFAESNPALDVEGKDAVNKLTIVLQHAYGITVKPETIVHKGITQLHSSDTKYAAEKNYNIKLVANAKRIDDHKIVAFVLPTFVESKNQLHHIRNEFNGVLIGSKLADEQFLYGKGAGRYPTSSAVLSDIAALRYDYKYEYKKTKNNVNNYALSNDFLLKIFVSFNQDAEINVSFFDSIEDRYFNKNRNHLVGIISLKNLQQADWFYDETVSVIAFDGDDNKISTTTFLHETILN